MEPPCPRGHEKIRRFKKNGQSYLICKICSAASIKRYRRLKKDPHYELKIQLFKIECEKNNFKFINYLRNQFICSCPQNHYISFKWDNITAFNCKECLKPSPRPSFRAEFEKEFNNLGGKIIFGDTEKFTGLFIECKNKHRHFIDPKDVIKYKSICKTCDPKIFFPRPEI